MRILQTSGLERLRPARWPQVLALTVVFGGVAAGLVGCTNDNPPPQNTTVVQPVTPAPSHTTVVTPGPSTPGPAGAPGAPGPAGAPGAPGAAGAPGASAPAASGTSTP